MTHDELKQWLVETSMLLDEMDSEVTGGVQEWATFRETFKQAGETAGTLQADTEAALEKLATAYRSERTLTRQVLRDAYACAKGIFVAGRAAADEMLARAKSESERTREDARVSAIATLQDAREKAEEAVASADRLAAQRTLEAGREAELILEEARRTADETVTSAERQAAETLGAAQHNADALLEEANRKAAEAVASAERQAAETLGTAQHNADALLEEANQKAAEAVTSAERQAAETLGTAQHNADALLEEAGQKAAEAVASAERQAAETFGTAQHNADALLEEANWKAEEAVASAERQAAETLGAAQHNADALLEEANRKAEEAVASAERQAAETLGAAQRNADSLLEEAGQKADEAVAFAERQAAETLAEARLTLDEAQQQSDAVKRDADQYLSHLIEKMERLLPEQEALARASEHLMQEYATMFDMVGRVQANVRSEVVPRLRRLLAQLRNASVGTEGVADMLSPNGGPESAAEAQPGPGDAFEPARRGGPEADELVGSAADRSEVHPLPQALGSPYERVAKGRDHVPAGLTGTVALEGASDAVTDQFVEAMRRLPTVKQAVLSARWQVPRLAMVDVTIEGDSLASLDFTALDEFTVHVTNTTQTMVVLRVEERDDLADAVAAQSDRPANQE